MAGKRRSQTGRRKSPRRSGVGQTPFLFGRGRADPPIHGAGSYPFGNDDQGPQAALGRAVGGLVWVGPVAFQSSPPMAPRVGAAQRPEPGGITNGEPGIPRNPGSWFAGGNEAGRSGAGHLGAIQSEPQGGCRKIAALGRKTSRWRRLETGVQSGTGHAGRTGKWIHRSPGPDCRSPDQDRGFPSSPAFPRHRGESGGIPDCLGALCGQSLSGSRGKRKNLPSAFGLEGTRRSSSVPLASLGSGEFSRLGGRNREAVSLTAQCLGRGHPEGRGGRRVFARDLGLSGSGEEKFN